MILYNITIAILYIYIAIIVAIRYKSSHGPDHYAVIAYRENFPKALQHKGHADISNYISTRTVTPDDDENM